LVRHYSKILGQCAWGTLWGPIERFITIGGGLVGLLVAFNQRLIDWLVGTYHGIPWWVGLIILGALLLQAFFRAGYKLWRVEQQARQTAEHERDKAESAYKTLEQGVEKLGVKITSDLDAQINRTRQLTNELRDERLEEELREIKQQRNDLQTEIEKLQEQDAPQPGELKRLCSHLVDELEHEDMLYREREEAIQLWIPRLKDEGFAESEIDEKTAAAGDDNTIGALKRYNKHLKGRLLKLYDALEPQGWLGAVDRSRIENLDDPYDMRRLARRLREVCGKLPDA
jgi:hypothetical protein